MVVILVGGIFEVLVVWLIVASGEGGRHLLSGQRTAERTRTSGRRAIHASFRAPRFVLPSTRFSASRFVILVYLRVLDLPLIANREYAIELKISSFLLQSPRPYRRPVHLPHPTRFTGRNRVAAGHSAS